MDRVHRLKSVLWTIIGIAAAVGMTRYIFGLGATTNLTDRVPWGLWIGFDVMGGVALAAGGFVVTAIYYIFRREELHPIVKPAVLTAFLGYLAVAFGLLFDLGLPWNIWHMIIFWNPHSPLFEVGWCVMLYLAVLLLEFSPVPLESFSAWAKIRSFLIKWKLVLVILGISLSTLHQSSLGSLFLLTPYKLHPFWYTPILPILFFISAVYLGLMMASWESLFTTHVYRREKETSLIAHLVGAARWVILLYVIVRFGDLFVRGQLGSLAEINYYTVMFGLEITIVAIVPFILTMIPKVRDSNPGQWFIASFGVFGVVFNRTVTGGLAHLVQDGASRYIPAWTEFIVSAGVVSFMAILFLFFVEHFKVWEQRAADPSVDPEKLPEFDKASNASIGTPLLAGWTKNSLIFISAAAVGLMFMSGKKVASQGIDSTPVSQARGCEVLMVDGNLDGYGVKFPHAEHITRIGSEPEKCTVCHHMNLPGDSQTECSNCHSEMYQSVDAFRHDWHASSDGANISCFKCHDKGKPKDVDSAVECSECHQDLIPAGATIKVDQYNAPGYVDALHIACIRCHETYIDTVANRKIDECSSCHKGAITPENKKFAEIVMTKVKAGKFQITPEIKKDRE
ncbi:MAG: Ni/Fe-hydrogenase cytochrome b subunit [Candidatus Electryonea clarkiae]|nr:Ni/Fe-hydrogenase cytochrome b subunit [Candidatus Electryonea clarkiae]MDP8285262.1 Ni/Fe-hydrogenase cytochrome b subunit [Candidatus Electryonea clarkiae]